MQGGRRVGILDPAQSVARARGSARTPTAQRIDLESAVGGTRAY